MNEKGGKSEILYANKEIYPYIHSSWNTLSKLGDDKITLNADNYVISLWVLPGYTSYVFSLYIKDIQKVTVFKKPMIDFPGYFSLGTMISSNLPNTLVTIYTDEYQFDDCPMQYKDMKFNEQVMIVNKWVFK